MDGTNPKAFGDFLNGQKSARFCRVRNPANGGNPALLPSQTRIQPCQGQKITHPGVLKLTEAFQTLGEKRA